MLTELQYRNFDELLDSVRIDIPTLHLENSIEPQQLIKVAARVTYELGLKVNPLKSKTIEIVKGKGRLPSDFSVLNFALLCDGKNRFYNSYPTPYDYKTYCQGVVDGQELSNDILQASMNTIYTEITDIDPGSNIINHGLCTTDFIVQVKNSLGQLLDYNVTVIDDKNIDIQSAASTTISDVTVTLLTGGTLQSLRELHNELNPCNDGTVSAPCVNKANTCDVTNDCGTTIVTCAVKGEECTYSYSVLIPLTMNKTKTLSADSFNLMTKNSYAAMLKNGFLVTNFDKGTVYLNYQSLMEDDEGNLLVMSHPLVDEFYEYAIKQRIYENMIMNGDTTANNQLQIIETRLRVARTNALSFINTPDFNDMKRVWKMNRKAQYHKYYDMFKSHPTGNHF